jgi:ABC-type nitrate/sulfonate/bicarbonate transport system permease component
MRRSGPASPEPPGPPRPGPDAPPRGGPPAGRPAPRPARAPDDRLPGRDDRPPGPSRTAARLAALGVLAALVAGWEAASRAGVFTPYHFPAPSRLAATCWELFAEGFPQGIGIGTHLTITLARIAQGYALAVGLAIPVGLVIGWLPVLDRLALPLITFARSVATLSLLPLAIVWFGVGELSKVLLIAYGCFWVMLTNVIAGVQYIDPALIRAARTLETGPVGIFLRVALPAALPRMFAGMRVALGVGFMVIVGVEMIGTIQGLGALILEARTYYRSDVSLVGMAVIGLCGFAASAGLARLERVLLPWDRGLEQVRR